jgi:hypothetical protein
MTWLRKIAAELFGLFVDDGSFAIAILVWLGVLWLALPHLPINNGWRAIILFAGLAIILVESVLRRARQRQA